MAVWSSGMILALDAKGSGFNSQNSPNCYGRVWKNSIGFKLDEYNKLPKAIGSNRTQLVEHIMYASHQYLRKLAYIWQCNVDVQISLWGRQQLYMFNNQKICYPFTTYLLQLLTAPTRARTVDLSVIGRTLYPTEL